MKETDLAFDDLPKGLRAVYDYWRGLGGEELRCSWKQFDLSAIPSGFVPSTTVVDIGPTMEDNRFRFWGSQMTLIYGSDMTGKLPYELEPRDMAGAVFKNHFKVIEARAPSASIFEFVKASGTVHSHRILRLPLSDDGESVSQIVVVDLTAAPPEHKQSLLSGD
jgi:hypothetical protein